MDNYSKLIEQLAELEHKQWQSWAEELTKQERISPTRLARWKTLFKPYSKLSETQKNQDREWAEKVIELVPFKCPIWQCGGIMKIRDSFKPEEGSWQLPDLICTYCKGIYTYIGNVIK